MPSCVGNAFQKCPRGDKGSAQLHALYQCQHDDSCYGQILLFLHTLPHEDKWTNTTGKIRKIYLIECHFCMPYCAIV